MTANTSLQPSEPRTYVVSAPISDALLALMADSMSENTARAYGADLEHVAEWLISQGYAAGSSIRETVLVATADPAVVAEYVSAHADTLKPSTLRRRVSSISKAHRVAAAVTGREDARPTRHPQVSMALQGAARRFAKSQTEAGHAVVKRAPALDVDSLRTMLDTMTAADVRDARDRAMLALGFTAGLRRSELVALDVADVQVRPQGLLVMVRRSKTDQTGRGAEVPVHRIGGAHCPVALWEAYLEARGDLDTAAAFTQITRGGTITTERLGVQAVGRILTARAKRAGVAIADRLSAHSLRAGCVTALAVQGAALPQIMAVTRHKTPAVAMSYVREADPFALTTALAL